MVQVACEPFATVADFDEGTCPCAPLSEEQIEDLIAEASDLLAVASRGMFRGRCTTVVRPCRNVAVCECGAMRPCGCSPDAVRLPGVDPVVLDVVIDGTSQPLENFLLLDGNMLVRLGGGRWPNRQHLAQPHTENGTWAIEVEWGHHVSQIAAQATIELVCELAKGCQGAKTALPPNAQSAVIGGVSIGLQRRAEIIRETAGTGDLPKVARFLSAVMPYGVPSTVWSPELYDFTLHVVDGVVPVGP